MSSKEWKPYKLGDLIDVNAISIVGNFPFEEIDYIDTSSVTKNKFEPFQRLRLSEAPSRAKRIVRDGDTIISTVRPIQRHFGFIKKAKENTIASTGFAVLSPKEIHPEFLYYYISQDTITNYLDGIAETTTSTFPAFRPEILEDLEVTIPEDSDVQSRIAEILSALDEKIELNRQTNATLEEMAQAIFKEWFVDFRFPGATGEMQRCEMRMIPKGWQLYLLGDLIDSVSITHSFDSQKIIFLNTSDIENGRVLHNDYSRVDGLPGQAKKTIKKYDILFSEIRPSNRRFSLVDFDADNYVVSTKLMVLRTISNVHPIVIYNYITSPDILIYLQYLAESRSGTFPQITFEQLRDLKLALPSGELLEKYSILAWSFFKEIKANERQSAVISQLRDILLPKLMNREIDV